MRLRACSSCIWRLCWALQQATARPTPCSASGCTSPGGPSLWSSWVGRVNGLCQALSALVAGDIFSSEDHNRTWKMVLTRSRTREQLFAGKLLAAVAYSFVIVTLLAVSGVVAALVSGPSPLVGLSGQMVPGKESFWLVLASWATQIPPLLAFVGLAILLSVWSRSSVVGIGGPVVVGLCLQVASLISMPVTVRTALPTTAFQAWTGFWTEPQVRTTADDGIAHKYSLVRPLPLLVVGDFPPPEHPSAVSQSMPTRCRTLKCVLGLIVAISFSVIVAGCGSTGISARAIGASISRTFANLYILQQGELGSPSPTRAPSAVASCRKGNLQSQMQSGPGTDWRYGITFAPTGTNTLITAWYDLNVQANGCYATDEDGPDWLNGQSTISGPRFPAGTNNPLYLIDGCFELT